MTTYWTMRRAAVFVGGAAICFGLNWLLLGIAHAIGGTVLYVCGWWLAEAWKR